MNTTTLSLPDEITPRPMMEAMTAKVEVAAIKYSAYVANGEDGLLVAIARRIARPTAAAKEIVEHTRRPQNTGRVVIENVATTRCQRSHRPCAGNAPV